MQSCHEICDYFFGVLFNPKKLGLAPDIARRFFAFFDTDVAANDRLHVAWVLTSLSQLLVAQYRL